MYDIETELQLLIDLFKEIFKPSKPKPFGSKPIGVQGLCDGNFGIQWNVWVDYKDESAMIGVNLEGLQYFDWPISKLYNKS